MLTDTVDNYSRAVRCSRPSTGFSGVKPYILWEEMFSQIFERYLSQRLCINWNRSQDKGEAKAKAAGKAARPLNLTLDIDVEGSHGSF